jgi:hypothetical protein
MAKPSRMTLGHIVNEGGLKPHCWLIMAKNLGKLVGNLENHGETFVSEFWGICGFVAGSGKLVTSNKNPV